MHTGTHTLQTSNVDSLITGTLMGLDDGIIVPENFFTFFEVQTWN